MVLKHEILRIIVLVEDHRGGICADHPDFLKSRVFRRERQIIDAADLVSCKGFDSYLSVQVCQLRQLVKPSHIARGPATSYRSLIAD